MSKKLFVIKGDDTRFIVREEEDAYEIGGTYDGQPVESMIELPEECDALDGLMAFDEVEGAILHALDAAYNRGRLDERARINRRIERTLIGE